LIQIGKRGKSPKTELKYKLGSKNEIPVASVVGLLPGITTKELKTTSGGVKIQFVCSENTQTVMEQLIAYD